MSLKRAGAVLLAARRTARPAAPTSDKNGADGVPEPPPTSAVHVFDWVLFLASYSPLFVIAAFRWADEPHVCLAMALLALVTMAPQIFVLKYAAKQLGRKYVVQSVSSRAEVNASYLATYLLPFVTVEAPKAWYVWCAYAAFIWLVGLISTRGKMIYVNPLLYALNFEISRVETADGTFNLISRRAPNAPASITATRLLRGNLLFELANAVD